MAKRLESLKEMYGVPNPRNHGERELRDRDRYVGCYAISLAMNSITCIMSVLFVM